MPRGTMKLYYFSEMPFRDFPDDEAEQYSSLRLTVPNRYFKPATASENLGRYLDEYAFADEVGFAGLMVTERHSTPVSSSVSANMMAGILARITRRAKILI